MSTSGEFHRIRRLPPYVFAEVNSAKAKARTAGDDIIDLGMGNPDRATPPHIVAKLIETVQDPRSHRYSVSKGIPGLRRALASYYERRFNVHLNPETEVVATLGSKEGLANLASAITSPGDTILVPNPSYPIHQFGFIIAGAAVRSYPVRVVLISRVPIILFTLCVCKSSVICVRYAGRSPGVRRDGQRGCGRRATSRGAGSPRRTMKRYGHEKQLYCIIPAAQLGLAPPAVWAVVDETGGCRASRTHCTNNI